ncbi:hypothetical protein SESBI_33003 [Sesbania bispinosa]|nr:hypothetical protein SESBI_33003 [Sesbania bispinosa]
MERAQRKSHRKVKLLSPIPKPPAEEEKKLEEKEKPKPEEKKEEEDLWRETFPVGTEALLLLPP